MSRYRVFLAACLLAAAAILASPTRAMALVPHAESAPAQAEHAAAGQEEHGGEGHEASWLPVIAKTFNFAILVGVLVYFLRTPLLGYLDGRIGRVREDLVTAAQTREAATRALADIDAKLKALPGEIETLKRRGAEDLAAERERIEQAAEGERQRLLEHTRREIEMRLRVAKRELLELTANLAVGVASERIKRSITPDDQARLVDRYATQLARDAGGAEGARL